MPDRWPGATVRDLARMRWGRAVLAPWPTAVGSLDVHLGGGLYPGQLAVVAAAPGTGKSALGLQVARNTASSGQPAVLVIYEHTVEEMLLRLTCLESPGGSGLDMPRLRAALRKGSAQTLEDAIRCEPEASVAWTRIAGYWHRLHLIEADPGVHTARIIDRWMGTGPRALWVIDSLQQIAPDSDELEMSLAARAAMAAHRLKRAARAYSVPVLATSQVATAALLREEPGLGDLEGGARVAHVCDVLLAGAARAGTVTWRLLKNRNGPADVAVPLHLDGAHLRFEEVPIE